METAPPPTSPPLVTIEVTLPPDGDAEVRLALARSPAHVLTASLDMTANPTRVLLSVEMTPLGSPSSRPPPPPTTTVPVTEPHTIPSTPVSTPSSQVLTSRWYPPSLAFSTAPSPISPSLCEVSIEDEDEVQATELHAVV